MFIIIFKCLKITLIGTSVNLGLNVVSKFMCIQGNQCDNIAN